MVDKNFLKGQGKVLVKASKEVKSIWLTSRSMWPFVTLCYLNVKVWPIFSHVSSS